MKENNIYIKIAETENEKKQIHALNHKTFAEEIKQHKANENGLLVDKFDDENIYYIALIGDEVIGMLAIRDKRPFSLDRKLDNLDELLPPHKNALEIRLLIVKDQYRRTRALYDLIEYLINDRPGMIYDLVVISGNINQKRLYRHMGFVEMGPEVGTEEAKYQPMYLTRESYIKKTRNIFKKNEKLINLLPGPVEISQNVKEAFSRDTISHRSKEFKKVFSETKELLLGLTSAENVEIITGTGTTANDVVAGQISLLGQKGLILSNGEFGDRLCKQADNFGIEFDNYNIKWGDSFSIIEIEKRLSSEDYSWIWFVHHETSTGVLNPLSEIIKLSKQFNIKVCTDAISSLGTRKTDFSDIYLASGVSSKGVASFSGLALIFYNHSLIGTEQKIPQNINLAKFANSGGIPFTLSSNLLLALNQSLKNIIDIDARYNKIKTITDKLRKELGVKGYDVLVSPTKSSNTVLTVVIPEGKKSLDYGNILRENNILLSFESSYLVEKNWIQICVMGGEPDYENAKKVLEYI